MECEVIEQLEEDSPEILCHNLAAATATEKRSGIVAMSICLEHAAIFEKENVFEVNYVAQDDNCVDSNYDE